jgi:hypothetical protein
VEPSFRRTATRTVHKHASHQRARAHCPEPIADAHIHVGITCEGSGRKVGHDVRSHRALLDDEHASCHFPVNEGARISNMYAGAPMPMI